MRVPCDRRGGRTRPNWLAAALLTFAALSAHALPRGPQPAISLPLAGFGFPGMPQGLRDSGASLVSVHFVDSTHLLLTYSLRGLVERIPDDPPDDEDRAVAALLVELPTGKVLARTRWHLHDHGQYLWSIGDGRFLLRVRSTLMAFAPVVNLASGDPFRQTVFLRPMGPLSALIVAPEHDVVTVESMPERAPKNGAQATAQTGSTADAASPPTLFTFVRVVGTGSPDSPITAVAAGMAHVHGVGGLPLNGRGYLSAETGKRNRWSVRFDSFDGQMKTLASVDSSCSPQMQFVSPSQYVVFSCRGSSDNLIMSAFDFAPHEMWEEPMSGSVPFSQFAYAQQAGRFALTRTTSVSTAVNNPFLGASSLDQGSSSSQEIRIYQVQSGDLLLKLLCSPISRTGQNFDLSADGLSLVVLRESVMELYRLPPLSAQDKKDLAEVQQFEPPPNNGAVVLHRSSRTARAAEAPAAAPAEPPSSAISTPTPAGSEANAPSGTVGDVDRPRRPPSLLNPGESTDGANKPNP